MDQKKPLKRPAFGVHSPLLGALTMGVWLALAPIPVYAQCDTPTSIPNPLWLNQTPTGTESGEEREFKFSFRGTGLGEFSTLGLAQQVNAVLDQARQNDALWQVPRMVSADPNNPVRYQILTGANGNQITDARFLDVYFDTGDDLNYLFDALYRFRQRFDNAGQVEDYLAGGMSQATHRESVSKVGRTVLEPGLSATTEHRLENLPARSARDIDQIICEFQSGTLAGNLTMPAKALVDFLIGGHHVNKTQLSFLPQLIILTERRRQRLQIPISAGGEHMDAFLVTVDRVEVYEAEAMLEFMRGNVTTRPTARGSFTEVEVEFERNVSTSVSDELRSAFLADQRTVMSQIQARFAQINTERGGNFIALQPEIRSKYAQAYEILFNLAQGKSVRQSSTAFDAPAERAVDGNIDGDFFEGSVTHTNFQNSPFWEVDLGGIQTISSFEIWNRTDCCTDRLQSFYVIVSTDPIASNDLSEVLAQPGVTATFFSGPGEQVTRASSFARGRFVRIQLVGENYLSLAEVKVFGHRLFTTFIPPIITNPPNLLIFDLARGKSASQSSTAFDAPAERAVDNNTNGDFFEGNSVTHTDLQGNPFWEVDLGSQFFITGFEVWNRTDCCAERLQDFFVIISSSPFQSGDLEEVRNQPGVTVTRFPGQAGHISRATVTARGQYVRVQLAGTNWLHLAEVKVFGHRSLPRVINRARGKDATQSSTAFDAPAERAVDGNTNGDFFEGSVTHTDNENRPFWEVDLGAQRFMSGIEIWNRTDCCGERLRDFWVLVSSTPFETNNLDEARNKPGVYFAFFSGPVGQLTHAALYSGNGRFVRVQLSGTNYLSLAEVRVLGRGIAPDFR